MRKFVKCIIGASVAVFLAATAFLCVLPAGVCAAEGPGVSLSWKTPRDVSADKISGYNVYRSESIIGHFDRINDAPLSGLSYDDRGLDSIAGGNGLELGETYYYRVTTVFTDGTESAPCAPVGMEAGGPPEAQEHRLPEIEFFTSDALGRILYLEETAVFILKGTPGLTAYLSITGVTGEILMEEVQPGTYKGGYTVPPGAKVSLARATVRLEDAGGGRAVASTPAEINLLGWRKPSLKGLYAGILEADRIGLNWPAYEGTDKTFSLFRDTSPVVGTEDLVPLVTNLGGSVCAYIDAPVVPGTTYYYVLALVSSEGLLDAYSDNLQVKVPEAGKVSGIESVMEDSGGRTLMPGDVLNVTMRTVAGGEAVFSLGEAIRDARMAEAEPGVYKGAYSIREGDGVFSSRVAVSFRDSSGKSRFSNSATFVSVNAPRLTAEGTAAGGTAPQVFGISDNIQSVVGVSGSLTAGKTFRVTITGDPGNRAFFSIGESVWKVPMAEDPEIPGTYTGEYTVQPGDNAGTSGDPLNYVYVKGYLQSPAGAVSEPVVGVMPVVIDTTCNIDVAVSETRLRADASSRARVVFTVTDADGEPVADRRLTVALEPPPRYTGVVGGGGVGIVDPEQPETGDGVLGRIELDFDDLTGPFGQVGATYTSGYAAKTAMIVARDYTTGSVGMGYVTTEISSSASITLLDPETSSTVQAPGGPLYELVVEIVPEDPVVEDVVLPYFMVNVIPDRLTADGRSRATVVATLTKDGMPVEDRRIIFAVTGAGGSLTSPSALTDALGRAQVIYIAGTKAGRAIITATEPETGVSVTKTITLLADAPAKIFAAAMPDVLPADGISNSEIIVRVTDVNNNPTDGIRLSYDIGGSGGPGSLSEYMTVTDADGRGRVYYTAGLTPGVVTVNVTAGSEPPTDEELERALSRVAAPLVYDFNDFTEVVVRKWYVSVGDRVGRGEPLALMDTPLGDVKVYSPVTGTLEEIIVDSGIYVMEGREIGVVAR